MTSFVHIPQGSHFSLRNVPFGVASFGSTGPRIPVTAIGDQVVDLRSLAEAGLFSDVEGAPKDIFHQATLNEVAALPRKVRSAVRERIQSLLTAGSSLEKDEELRKKSIRPQNEATMHLPVAIQDYTDFCASEQHTKNCAKLIETNSPPLPPSWIHLPIGYHGRASSVVVSGTPIKRPLGVVPTPNGPIFGPCRALDYELEMAAVLGGKPNALGTRLTPEDVEENVFGVVIMNDWSARDIQGFEMIPLGPFNGKNFGTTISPWIVTLDALRPFKTGLPPRPQEANGIPQLSYLVEKDQKSTFDIRLEVQLKPKGGEPTTTSTSNLRYLTYSFGQMLAHQTVGGCPITPGDLLGSGTVTGPNPKAQEGSLLELSMRGKEPFTLKDGKTRTFVEDGDTIILIAVAGDESEGLVGFGSAVGEVLPASE
ncbi:fumarylacetoacetase [Meredithblackwellia eburnea MCA 4105]